MNIRNFTFILITGLILSSCSKEDNTTDDLIGTWTAGASTFIANVGDKTMVQYFTDVMGLSAAEAQQFAALFTMDMQQSFTGTIQFKSDGTYVDNMGGTTDTGTWSLSSDRKTLTIDSSSDSPMELDVIELTSGNLHLNVSETDSVDINEDGAPEILSISIDLTFTK